MEENAVSKTRSFRITEEVMEKFKAISAETNLTQDKALQMLVNLYETESAKRIIPDREKEIENFQMHTSALLSSFLQSLQLNMDAEERIRADFVLQLTAKDETIALQKEKIESHKAEVESLKSELEKSKKEIGELLEE